MTQKKTTRVILMKKKQLVEGKAANIMQRKMEVKKLGRRKRRKKEGEA